MTEEIKVSRGIPITVNDAGETITMHPENQNFIERFYGLVDKLENISAELRSEEVSNAGDHEQLIIVIDRTKSIMAEIDAMFGHDSCRKIFGEGVIPSPYLIADFFEQLQPIAEKYANVRQQEIKKKYNNSYKGARTSKYRTKEELIQEAMGKHNV